MLDPETPDERRDQIAQDARQRIEGKGSLKTEKAWGMRKLAYEIEQRTEADYRFFRFETESPLLDELDHNLKITDGVMRFRIFKVDPRSPVIEPPPPVSLVRDREAPRGSGGPRRGEGEGRPPAPAPAAPTEQPAPAEQPPAATEQPPEAAPSAPAEQAAPPPVAPPAETPAPPAETPAPPAEAAPAEAPAPERAAPPPEAPQPPAEPRPPAE